MTEILEVRLEDGSVAAIDAGLTSGSGFNGVATSATALVLDTGFSPPPGEGACVSLTFNAHDPTGNADAGDTWIVALNRTSAGVLTVAGSGDLGAGLNSGTPKAVGTAALTADLAVTFTVSATNTLVMHFAVSGYANPVNIAGVLLTGATG